MSYLHFAAHDYHSLNFSSLPTCLPCPFIIFSILISRRSNPFASTQHPLPFLTDLLLFPDETRDRDLNFAFSSFWLFIYPALALAESLRVQEPSDFVCALYPGFYWVRPLSCPRLSGSHLRTFRGLALLSLFTFPFLSLPLYRPFRVFVSLAWR